MMRIPQPSWYDVAYLHTAEIWPPCGIHNDPSTPKNFISPSIYQLFLGMSINKLSNLAFILISFLLNLRRRVHFQKYSRDSGFSIGYPRHVLLETWVEDGEISTRDTDMHRWRQRRFDTLTSTRILAGYSFDSPEVMSVIRYAVVVYRNATRNLLC